MRVSAVNECGVGEPSMNSDKFVPQEPTSEVMNFACDEVDDTSAKLSWDTPLEIGQGSKNLVDYTNASVKVKIFYLLKKEPF